MVGHRGCECCFQGGVLRHATSASQNVLPLSSWITFQVRDYLSPLTMVPGSAVVHSLADADAVLPGKPQVGRAVLTQYG